ncbi:MAG: lasso peptide biosynthesis B2 protein [Gemmatimonadales bacterium]
MSASDWLDLVRGFWALVSARLLLWSRPRGSFVATEHVDSAPSTRVTSDALRWARAVNRAAAYGPYRARCLVRSIALQRLLESRGIRGSRVCIGVRKVGSVFAAHAWVDLSGEIIGDLEARVSAFDRLSDIRLAGRN